MESRTLLLVVGRPALGHPVYGVPRKHLVFNLSFAWRDQHLEKLSSERRNHVKHYRELSQGLEKGKPRLA